MIRTARTLLTLLAAMVLFGTSLVRAEDIVVTVAAGSVGAEFESTRKACEWYMQEHPGVTVKPLHTPNDAQGRLGLYLQFLEAKSPKLDVYMIDVTWPGELAEHFLDLYRYGGRKAAASHFQAIVENNVVDGRLVAMPWFMDAGLLYYRKDLLKKHGLSVPRTWEELGRAATVIQKAQHAAGNIDFWGFVFQGDDYEGLTCDALEWLSSSGGGRIVSSKGRVTLDNDRAIEAVGRIASWVGTCVPPAVASMNEERSRAMWQAGYAAFMRNWPYAYTLGRSSDSAIRGKFGVAPLPAAHGEEPAATLGGWQLAVSRYSRHPEVAADVALFLASERVQKMRAVASSKNPTIKSLYKDPEVLAANPFFKDLYHVFVNAVARPSTVTAPNYNRVSQAFYRAVYSVLVGETDARTALENAALDIHDITGLPLAGED